MRFTLSLCSIATTCLISAGCAGTRPVHFYTLEPATVPAAQSKPDGPIMVVGHIATPEALQDGRIRYRAGTNEVGGYEYHRWTARPGDLVHDALVRVLRASGNYQHVLESSSSTVGDYLLRGKLSDFGEVDNPTIQTRISLHLELIDRKTNRGVWDHHYDHVEPASGKTITDVVQSMDRNLQQVIGEVAAEIGKFVATRQ